MCVSCGSKGKKEERERKEANEKKKWRSWGNGFDDREDGSLWVAHPFHCQPGNGFSPCPLSLTHSYSWLCRWTHRPYNLHHKSDMTHAHITQTHHILTRLDQPMPRTSGLAATVRDTKPCISPQIHKNNGVGYWVDPFRRRREREVLVFGQWTVIPHQPHQQGRGQGQGQRGRRIQGQGRGAARHIFVQK